VNLAAGVPAQRAVARTAPKHAHEVSCLVTNMVARPAPQSNKPKVATPMAAQLIALSVRTHHGRYVLTPAVPESSVVPVVSFVNHFTAARPAQESSFTPASATLMHARSTVRHLASQSGVPVLHPVALAPRDAPNPFSPRPNSVARHALPSLILLHAILTNAQ